MPTQAVAYCRKSKEDRDKTSLSLEHQEATCREFAARKGWTVVAAHHDLGVSGDVELHDRPGLKAAIQALTRNAKLIVLRRDRLFRADEYTRGVVNRAIEARGGEVWSTQGEGSGEPGATGMMVRSIVDTMAFAELLRIRERTREVLDRKRAGRQRSGQVAYGQRVTPDGLAVEPDRIDAQALELARRLRGEGWPIRSIADAFRDLGIRPKNAGRVKLSRLVELQALLAGGRRPDEAAAEAGVPLEAVDPFLELVREGRSVKAAAALLPSRVPPPAAAERWSVTSIRRLLGEVRCVRRH